MSFRRITLKDISKTVGLTVPVISRILNGKATYCSAQKIREVKETAARLGYRSNPGYRIMTGDDTNIVAVVFSQRRITHHPHINQLYMNLCTKLRKHNYSSYCAVLDIQSSAADQLSQLQELDDLGCRSYIFIGHPTGFAQLLDFVRQRKRSFVTMNNFRSPRNVALDNAGMFIDFVNGFIKNGLTRFRIVTHETFLNDVILPRVAPEDHSFYRQIFYPRPSTPIISDEPDAELFDIGYNIAAGIHQEVPDIQAVVFTSDYLAFGAAGYFRSCGADSVKVCGMNKSIAANYAFSPIYTTVFDMDFCAEQLIDHLKGTDDVDILVPGKIVYCDVLNRQIPAGTETAPEKNSDR